MGVKRAVLKSDSQVIIGHVDKSSRVRSLVLEKYHATVQRLEGPFKGFSVKNMPRVDKEHTDMLAKLVAQGLALPLKFSWSTKSTFGGPYGESCVKNLRNTQ